jgi:hypothetical protein
MFYFFDRQLKFLISYSNSKYFLNYSDAQKLNFQRVYYVESSLVKSISSFNDWRNE